MKISQLMNDIIRTAEAKFHSTDHMNDVICFSIYPMSSTYEYGIRGEWDWQVSLMRPTKRDLDRGEVGLEQLHTVKVEEVQHGFHAHNKTLLGALLDVQRQVNEAESWLV
jgi:hypothetical protein